MPALRRSHPEAHVIVILPTPQTPIGAIGAQDTLRGAIEERRGTSEGLWNVFGYNVYRWRLQNSASSGLRARPELCRDYYVETNYVFRRNRFKSGKNISQHQQKINHATTTKWSKNQPNIAVKINHNQAQLYQNTTSLDGVHSSERKSGSFRVLPRMASVSPRDMNWPELTCVDLKLG